MLESSLGPGEASIPEHVLAHSGQGTVSAGQGLCSEFRTKPFLTGRKASGPELDFPGQAWLDSPGSGGRRLQMGLKIEILLFPRCL